MRRIFICFTLIICLATLISCRKENGGNENASDSNIQDEQIFTDTATDEHVCTYDASIEIIAPGCETEGYTLRTCSCGKTLKDQITTALGHTWGNWEIESEPTDTSAGIIKRACAASHYESAEIPPLNTDDYRLEAINGGEITARCDSPEFVYYIYNHIFGSEDEPQSQEIRLVAEYLPEHTYTDKYLYSSENHYKHCDVCLNFTKDTEEPHTMVRNKCYICNFVPHNVSYTEESYGLAVIYDANEKKATIPEFYCGADIQHVGKKIKGIKSFKGNEKLCEVTIPASVEYIDPFAFEGCTALQKVYYCGDIGDWCSINFSEGSNPLNYASSLWIANERGGFLWVEAIVLPSTISKVNAFAFEGLKNITQLTIPRSIKLFGDELNSVFSEDAQIGKVFYEGDYTDWCGVAIKTPFSNPMRFTNDFNMKNSLGEYYHPQEMSLPESITKIGDYQFIGFNSLTRLSFNAALIEIGSYAFAECGALMHVDVSNGCEKIGAFAFSDCGLLSTLRLSRNITQVKDYSFKQCLNLTAVYYEGDFNDWCGIEFSTPESNPMHANKTRNYQSAIRFYYRIEGKTDYADANAEVIRLESITRIGNYQFYGFSMISQIVLPESVEKIGDEAFAFCANLSSLTIPKDIKSIGKNILDGTSGFVEIYFSGSSDEWERISISSDNQALSSSTKHFNE